MTGRQLLICVLLRAGQTAEQVAADLCLEKAEVLAAGAEGERVRRELQQRDLAPAKGNGVRR